MDLFISIPTPGDYCIPQMTVSDEGCGYVQGVGANFPRGLTLSRLGGGGEVRLWLHGLRATTEPGFS
jgi:hypothetical protein